MNGSPADLPNTHSVGLRTREQVVGRMACPDLALLRIAATGLSDAAAGFTFVRHRPQMSQLLASRSGTGRVLIQGRFVPCPPGFAYITPPHVFHAYHATASARWQVCWVIYEHRPDDPPILNTDRPALIPLDPEPLAWAIAGLHRETLGPAQPALMHHWSALLHALVQRHAGSAALDTRLWRLWQAVDADLAIPWSNESLAALAGLSTEHLRRLCHTHFGRSPMRHVTYLRLRRAASLLASSAQPIDTIARQVGYQNPFAFSTAFKRHLKIPPSAYRQTLPRS